MGELNYLRYGNSIELTPPDEAQLTELIVASMGRVNRKIFDQHRHAVRDRMPRATVSSRASSKFIRICRSISARESSRRQSGIQSSSAFRQLPAICRATVCQPYTAWRSRCLESLGTNSSLEMRAITRIFCLSIIQLCLLATWFPIGPFSRGWRSLPKALRMFSLPPRRSRANQPAWSMHWNPYQRLFAR